MNKINSKKVITKVLNALDGLKKSFENGKMSGKTLSDALENLGESYEFNKEKFIRRGKSILTVKSGKTKHYDSINLAKKASVKLQLSENCALGRGSLVVI